MTTATVTPEPEPTVEEMVAEVVAKAKTEGRQEALVETKTMLTVLIHGTEAEKTFATRFDSNIEQRLEGKQQGLSEALAWVLMTANGGEMPEEFKS